MRDLEPPEVQALLRRGGIGRLGVYDAEHERTYVVPVSYVYREGAVYLHSAPGLKLQLMHERPANVCFEVDEIADEGEWQSVLAWGRFEEIRDAGERKRVLDSFGERLFRGPLRDRQHLGRSGLLGAGETVYRIVLGEMTGRADASSWVATESD
jgi:nitroimidazol reductase NimA-like FMN-containing flavoprotein (pyridoxamine 5'-phosphate oxidase superfamily)